MPESTTIPPPAEAFLAALWCHNNPGPEMGALKECRSFEALARTLDEYVDERIRLALQQQSQIQAK